ncbi:hypothetical protein [Lonomia obliqua multiple nucleopolyhedrovirus]|uniref:Uncharacterized protein n=1 Tax=Lonomia obliqua multiple nucleopolyhedrovirus TaxID=134394 RepID=A0A126FCB2_9ABAC|nr:hypothetical protein [Lonomia obliqua multiple nucleopolyhedrovirus]AKN81027.1 hypothetical protein [Lonomia obliqua multiple nucleopolyhedrovirus]
MADKMTTHSMTLRSERNRNVVSKKTPYQKPSTSDQSFIVATAGGANKITSPSKMATTKTPTKSSKMLQYEGASQQNAAAASSSSLSSSQPSTVYMLPNYVENKYYTEFVNLENTLLQSESLYLFKPNAAASFQKTALTNFVIAFAHPSYKTQYKITNDQKLHLHCYNVKPNQLFKNDSEKIINRLNPSCFKVQINSKIYSIKSAEYMSQNKLLNLILLERITQNVNKSIIYFNIINVNKTWQIPIYLKDMFDKMSLLPSPKSI